MIKQARIFFIFTVFISLNATAATWISGTPTATYSWFNGANWNPGVPADGDLADLEVDNTQRTYDINNGGAGVNLPSSQIDIGRGQYIDSAGGDDGIIADVIRFNGAGGQAPIMDVPFSANTLSSNRHGAVINVAWSATDILAQSGHQDKWQVNASPTAALNSLLLNENRGADGDSIDGDFRTNVDMSVSTIDHVWSRLWVGDAAATLTADTYNYTFYTNQATNNNDNPLQLDGNMAVTSFNMIDITTGTPVAQNPGTWGSLANGAVDNPVSWITGDGTLTVIPEPATSLLALFGTAAFCVRRRR